MPTEEKGRRHQTTTPERVQIFEKHAGECVRQIAKELDISKSRAQKIIHDWKKDGIFRIAPRTGC
jgi:transposase